MTKVSRPSTQPRTVPATTAGKTAAGRRAQGTPKPAPATMLPWGAPAGWTPPKEPLPGKPLVSPKDPDYVKLPDFAAPARPAPSTASRLKGPAPLPEHAPPTAAEREAMKLPWGAPAGWKPPSKPLPGKPLVSPNDPDYVKLPDFTAPEKSGAAKKAGRAKAAAAQPRTETQAPAKPKTPRGRKIS